MTNLKPKVIGILAIISISILILDHINLTILNLLNHYLNIK